MIDDARAAAAAGRARVLIDTLARAAFATLWRLLMDTPGLSPRDAIDRAQAEFGGGFADALAASFSQLLQRSVSIGEIRAMPVGDISLARSLYLHTDQTAAEVAAVVREHAAGLQEARRLSIALFDGYTPQAGVKRPLEGRARALLPRSLRELTAEPGARRTLTALQVRGQQQAARLKSRALRAAYLQAFEAWATGVGEDVLQRRLEVAQLEKNRFYADRIAQTELHRAHQAQVARDLMDDDATVVQVRINPLHPREDICDLHARADLFGLGEGCYPKELAPRPPFHPFCRCKLRTRPSLSLADAKSPQPAGEYLRSLGAERAARVMGSAARAQAVMQGAPVEVVVDAGKPRSYRTVRVGDARAQEHALLGEDETA